MTFARNMNKADYEKVEKCLYIVRLIKSFKVTAFCCIENLELLELFKKYVDNLYYTN